MIMVILAGVICLIKKLSIKFTKIDLSLSALYCFMMATFSYAEVIPLSVQMFFGLVLLLYSFFILRLFINQLTLSDFLYHLYFISKWFFILSFILYIIGVLMHYTLGVELVVEGETHNRAVLLGVYFEGGVIPRLRGVCDSPNNFGMYALILLPIWLTYSRQVKVWKLSLIILMFVLTLSVTTLLALFCMVLIFIFIKLLQFNGKLKTKYAIPFGIFILVGLLLAFYLSSMLLNDPDVYLNLSKGLEDRLSRANSGSGRFELWQYTFSLISERPFWGYGLNQARVLLAPFREVVSTHNNFLEVTLEGGVIGLLLYILLISAVILSLLSKRLANKERQWISLSAVSMFIFSNANVTIYSDSLIFFLAITSSIIVLKDSPSRFNPKSLTLKT
jgi:O-antigen ligase